MGCRGLSYDLCSAPLRHTLGCDSFPHQGLTLSSGRRGRWLLYMRMLL